MRSNEEKSVEQIEDEFHVRFSDEDSLLVEDVLVLHKRINVLQHQNEVSMQWLWSMEIEDAELKNKLLGQKKQLKKHE